LTTIDFLLPAGAVSRWHRVRSDEVWSFHEGAPLELWRVSPEHPRLECLRLGPRAPGQAPVHVVPANEWQAARSTGAYTLVNCTVGPGFDFADFELLADQSDREAALCRDLPEAAVFR
jgi:predicted cupin superfamily sugar epimerase